jgi:hypothetical protein
LKRGSPFAGAALALAMLLTSPVARSQEAADVEAARELYKEGRALIEAERWDEARDRFERSLALKRAPRTLFSLGVARQKTGRLADALESYRAFCVDPKGLTDHPFFEQATEAIADLEKRVAYVSLQIAPSPAALRELRVAIDGRGVPAAALGTRRLVDPGTHQVVAVAAGYREAHASVTVGEGGQASVSLSLEPVPALVEGPIVTPPTPDLAPRAPTRTLPIVLMAGGGAVLLAGVTVGMIGVSAAASAPTRDGPQANAARKKLLAGDVIGATGVVAGGAGLVLLLVRRPAASPAASARPGQVEPWILGSTAGVTVRF